MDSYTHLRTCRFDGDLCKFNRGICVPISPENLLTQDSHKVNEIARAVLGTLSKTNSELAKNLHIVQSFKFTSQRWDMHSKPGQLARLPKPLTRVPDNADCLHPCNNPQAMLYWEPFWDNMIKLDA